MKKRAYVLLPVVNSYVNTSIRIISISLARKPRGLTVIEFLLFIFFTGEERETYLLEESRNLPLIWQETKINN